MENYTGNRKQIVVKEKLSKYGQKIRSYTLDFKLKAVEFAENNRINATKILQNLGWIRRIREWKMKIMKMSEVK